MRISGIIGFDHHRDTEDTEFMKGMFRIESKRRYAEQTIFCLLFVLGVSVVHIFAQDFRTIAPGVEYSQVKREFSGQPVSMNLLRLDLTKVRLDVVHAMDAAIGTETVSSMAKRHGAFAAINGGFFRDDGSIWAGDPAGALAIDGKILSEPIHDRVGILIFDDPGEQTFMMSQLELGQQVVTLGGTKSIKVKGINRERLDTDDVVAYTPEFHQTTLTNSKGSEAVIRNGRVALIARDLGNSTIPPSGWVLSATGTYADIILSLHKGQVVGLPPRWGWVRRKGVAYDVTNGVPQLIQNSKVDITWEQEGTNLKFVEKRHPRTAVAKLKDGKFLMVTVDGRSESSGGISLFDLADYLLTLGATDAMNLDGGGSTTMYLDGKVVNHPSDPTGERKVSDAILVTLRKPAKKK
jgi:hypothetical protein